MLYGFKKNKNDLLHTGFRSGGRRRPTSWVQHAPGPTASTGDAGYAPGTWKPLGEGVGDGRNRYSKDAASALISRECRGFGGWRSGPPGSGLFCLDRQRRQEGGWFQNGNPSWNLEALLHPFHHWDKILSLVELSSKNIPPFSVHPSCMVNLPFL